MTKEELAAKLNGRQYREETTKEETIEAAAAGLLIVYGASDDLTEFEGVIGDEQGAGGDAGSFTTHKISANLRVIEEAWLERSDRERLIKDGWTPPSPAFTVKVEWCPNDLDASWRIPSDAPFAPFDIMEDDELYCRGAVIDVRAVTGVQLQKAS